MYLCVCIARRTSESLRGSELRRDGLGGSATLMQPTCTDSTCVGGTLAAHIPSPSTRTEGTNKEKGAHSENMGIAGKTVFLTVVSFLELTKSRYSSFIFYLIVLIATSLLRHCAIIG